MKKIVLILITVSSLYSKHSGTIISRFPIPKKKSAGLAALAAGTIAIAKVHSKMSGQDSFQYSSNPFWNEVAKVGLVGALGAGTAYWLSYQVAMFTKSIGIGGQLEGKVSEEEKKAILQKLVKENKKTTTLDNPSISYDIQEVINLLNSPDSCKERTAPTYFSSDLSGYIYQKARKKRAKKLRKFWESRFNQSWTSKVMTMVGAGLTLVGGIKCGFINPKNLYSKSS